MPVLYVYGTLRRRGSAAERMRGAAHLGRWSLPGFALYEPADQAYPTARRGHGRIVAEAWRIGASRLRALDRYEEVPGDYVRIKIDGPAGPGWIYLARLARSGERGIRSGDWLAIRPRRGNAGARDS